MSMMLPDLEVYDGLKKKKVDAHQIVRDGRENPVTPSGLATKNHFISRQTTKLLIEGSIIDYGPSTKM